MTEKAKIYLRDFIIENHITDYSTIKELIMLIELEEKLFNAEKELGVYGIL